MPMEFQRMVTALLAEDYEMGKAIEVASQDFARRHDAKKKEAEANALEAQSQMDAHQKQQQAEAEAQRSHEKDLARLKRPAPSASAKNAAPDLRHQAMLASNLKILRAHRLYGTPAEGPITILNAEKREIAGYASYWNEPMRDHRIVNAGAFPKETLDLFLTNPVLLFNHDDSLPVGVVLELKPDDKGLWCKAKVEDDDLWDKIKDGRLRAFSWMGIANQYHMVPDLEANLNAYDDPDWPPCVMAIDEAELWEISVVALPNSPQCLFEIVKSFSPKESDFTLWAPFRETDVPERMVFGYAMVWGEPDADGHVILKEDALPAVEAYRAWANIREMHGNTAVGTAPVLEVDDYGLWVGARISQGAEDCWNKICDRTYGGYSIGGYAERGEMGELGGVPVIFLKGIVLEEISVCDRPKVAKATFSLIKRAAPAPQGEAMPEETHEALETRRLTMLEKVFGVRGEANAADAAKVQNAAAVAAAAPSAEVTALRGDIVEFRAMTRATEAKVEKIESSIAEVLLALKALKAEPAAVGEGEEEEEEANAAKPGKKPPFMKKAANALDPELARAHRELVKNGATPAEALQELFASWEGEEDAFVELLGLTKPEKPTGAASQEQVIASAVAAATTAVMAQMMQQYGLANVSGAPALRNRQARPRHSTSVANSLGDAFHEGEASGKGTFAGCFPAINGARPRA